ncbi:hypothetical protein [Cellvibrio sp. PSBB006]|uniref:hypothetical protein n=1 Tax=Cellvibrio sp. PSBB006 TaxID=1987723 RepID=UPI001E327D0B|nr:hypothetical protein [Cellvibrio sp. PSBB006]
MTDKAVRSAQLLLTGIGLSSARLLPVNTKRMLKQKAEKNGLPHIGKFSCEKRKGKKKITASAFIADKKGATGKQLR